MPRKAVGQAAVELPWLCPNTDSLIAIADAPATALHLSEADPALALFLIRFAQSAQGQCGTDSFGFSPAAFQSAILPETASAFLAATSLGVLPTSSSALDRVRCVTERAVSIASALADSTRLVPRDVVARAIRLAPLGWYAVAAIDPFIAAEPLADPDFDKNPAFVQSQIWGLDQTSITRRLAARWRLPTWLATIIGSLSHKLSVATPLLVHRHLFAVVQLALLEAEQIGKPIGLTPGADRKELLDFLRVNSQMLRRLADMPLIPKKCEHRSGLNPNPHQVPLLQNLLRHAGESRRRNGPGLVARLEEQIDALHRLAADLGAQAGERLREAKLDGLAEFAAGAGHEINNPLAIISGNAQRLLRTEQEPDRVGSLQAIVRQTNRIAGLLRDLMQFARPRRSDPRVFEMTELLNESKAELADLATERNVRIEFQNVPGSFALFGDLKQLRQALSAVLRNAIEASPQGGWARVSCIVSDHEGPSIVVEDSGPGLNAEAVEHAFDPFYCGRTAGRGRGLGLSTAWKLLRLNGGDLRFDSSEGLPARFVISLRSAAGVEPLNLKSA